jgi:hypothetical protein
MDRFRTPNKVATVPLVNGTVDSHRNPWPYRTDKRSRGHRRPQEQHDHHRPQQVQAGQQARLGHAPAEPAGGVGTEDIEQTDQRQHRGADGRRQVLIHQIGRQCTPMNTT